MHRKPLTIDAWEGFRTSGFDGGIKSGTSEYGRRVSLIRFLPKAHPFGSPIYVARVPAAPLKLARCPHSLTASLAALPSMSLIPAAPFQNSKTILFKNLAPDNLTR
jgi:hypothetical protein